MSRDAEPAPAYLTLRTVAERAQVSPTTVSLALRNNPKISAATRERVQRAATDLGYKLNPLVSAHMSYLRTLRPLTSGLCLAFIGNRSLAQLKSDSKTQVRRYWESAQLRAEALGYSAEYFNLAAPGMSERRISQILLARGIRGVIIGPLGERAVSNLELEWNQFAAVMIEHALSSPRLDAVFHDEYSTIGRLLQRLIDYGHARIGIALPMHMDEHANHFWLAGYQAFQALTTPAARIPHFITDRWDKARFVAWYRRWRPDAIITINDEILGWLEELGATVPEDVSCVTPYWKADRSRLSGFYQNHELMAACAVDLLVAHLSRNELGQPASERIMLIQSEWREGQTISRRMPSKRGISGMRVLTR